MRDFSFKASNKWKLIGKVLIILLIDNIISNKTSVTVKASQWKILIRSIRVKTTSSSSNHLCSNNNSTKDHPILPKTLIKCKCNSRYQEWIPRTQIKIQQELRLI